MKSKRTSDGRKLDHAALDVASIAAAYGVNERSVYRSLADFANGGQKALRAKPISRRPAKVNVEEMRWPAQAVHGHTPLQFKFEYGLRLAGYSAAHANRQLGLAAAIPIALLLSAAYGGSACNNGGKFRHPRYGRRRDIPAKPLSAITSPPPGPATTHPDDGQPGAGIIHSLAGQFPIIGA